MAAWSRVGWLAGGWLLGVATVAALLAMAAAGLSAHGVAVPVAVGEVTAQVQGEVEAAVLAELPHAVQLLKEQVPGRVASEVRRRLERGDFRLGALPLAISPDLLGPAFDQQVEATVSSALDEMAGSTDSEGAARAVADRVSQLVRRHLTAAVSGWRVTLHPYRYLAVPVTLQPQP